MFPQSAEVFISPQTSSGSCGKDKIRLASASPRGMYVLSRSWISRNTASIDHMSDLASMKGYRQQEA